MSPRRGGLVVIVVGLGVATAAGARPTAAANAGVTRAGKGLGAVVRRLAARGLDGRDNGTPGSDKAQRLIVAQLRRIGAGLVPGRGRDAYRQMFTQSGQAGVNLLAVIRGRELPDEYVVLGAHYDHLGRHNDADGRCSTRFPAGTEICNGATDNAAGVAVVLAVGRALRKLRPPPRRSVVLALWDAEEDGLLGSQYYVEHPLVPLAATAAYLNFDIQGSNLLPSLARSTFAIGVETGGSALGAIVAAAGAKEPALQVRPLSYVFGQGRSDYATFVARNVPTAFFGDGPNGCYHTVDDDVAVVDRRKLAAQSRIGYRVAVALADADTAPSFRSDAPLAVYDDAVSLSGVFTDGLADRQRLMPADQPIIAESQAAIAALVAAGPAAFDGADLAILFQSALAGIDAIERAGCLAAR